MVIASGTRKGFISEVQDGKSWKNKEDFTWESRMRKGFKQGGVGFLTDDGSAGYVYM